MMIFKIKYVTGYMECGLIKPLWQGCMPIGKGVLQHSCS